MFEKKINKLEIKSEEKYNELLEDTNKNLYDMAIGEVSTDFRRKNMIPFILYIFGVFVVSFLLSALIHKNLFYVVFIGMSFILLKAYSIDYIQSKLKNPYDDRKELIE